MFIAKNRYRIETIIINVRCGALVDGVDGWCIIDDRCFLFQMSVMNLSQFDDLNNISFSLDRLLEQPKVEEVS